MAVFSYNYGLMTSDPLKDYRGMPVGNRPGYHGLRESKPMPNIELTQVENVSGVP